MPPRICARCARYLAQSKGSQPQLGSRLLTRARLATSPQRAAFKAPASSYVSRPPAQPRPAQKRALSTSPAQQHELAPNEPALDEFYADLLRQPLASGAAERRQVASEPPAQPSTVAEEQDPSSPAARARIIFGSRLAGPQRKREEADAARAAGQGEYIGATWIAPRPEQPDNCCMSGCVNCVWDAYQEELEGWVTARRAAMKTAEGEKAPKVENGRVVGGKNGPASSGADMEEVAGLMDAVPVGIREFMRLEKNLRERKEATA